MTHDFGKARAPIFAAPTDVQLGAYIEFDRAIDWLDRSKIPWRVAIRNSLPNKAVVVIPFPHTLFQFLLLVSQVDGDL